MASKAAIIPAVLPRDFAELQDKVSLVKSLASVVQVDVCDGQFVPNATWPYRKHDDSFDKIIREEMGMPDWEDVDFEIDLMANRPEEIVSEWLSAGASRIILHIEASGDLSKAISLLAGNVEVGLALNIATDISKLEPFIANGGISFIQCMGIDRIGFQGQEFDSKTIDKIREIRAKYPDMTISVDGGVSLDNAPSLIEAGADRLVVGSAIFESDNIVEAVQKFQSIANGD